jgi:hypothetical protein
LRTPGSSTQVSPRLRTLPYSRLPSRYDSAVRCTIRRVVVLQFEGLTRIALVALAAAVLGLDQQTTHTTVTEWILRRLLHGEL